MSVTQATQFDALVGTTDVSPVAVALVVKAYEANERVARSHTLTRGDVRGGGKKPWRQKGTGRARVGSSRNPVWRTGGVAHGPKKERNYTQAVNERTKQAVLKAALADAAATKRLFTVNAWPTDGKAKSVIDALRDDVITAKQLLILHGEMSAPLLARASQNLEGVTVQSAHRATVRDILRAGQIVADDAAWTVLANRIGVKPAAPKAAKNPAPKAAK